MKSKNLSLVLVVLMVFTSLSPAYGAVSFDHGGLKNDEDLMREDLKNKIDQRLEKFKRTVRDGIDQLEEILEELETNEGEEKPVEVGDHPVEKMKLKENPDNDKSSPNAIKKDHKIKDQGYLGPNNTYAKWELDNDGNLSLYGGQMAETDNKAWEKHRREIRIIRVGVGGELVAAEDMSGYFRALEFTEEIIFENIDTSRTKDMSYMFNFLDYIKELDLSKFNTSNVRNMSYMFYSLESLEELDISKFDTSNVTNMSYMFLNLDSLKKLDVSGFDTSKVEDMNHMFAGLKSLEELDVSRFDTRNVRDMNTMFARLETIRELDLTGFDTSKVEYMNHMFSNLKSLEKLDVSSFNTGKVKDMQHMFFGLKSLENLDVSNFDTSNVRDMSGMFSLLLKLEELDIGGFNTSNVQNMSAMFYKLENIKELDLSSFDTRNVEHMDGMFMNIFKLRKLDLSSFDTKNVNNISHMVSGSDLLEELVLGNKTILNESVHLVKVDPDKTYTGGWIRNDGEGIYKSSEKFVSRYKGEYPGTYIREFVSYPVTFKDGGDTLATLNSKPYNRKIDGRELPKISKEDDKFLGWNTRPDGSGEDFLVDNTPVVEEITVYAQWESNQLPIERLDVNFLAKGGHFADGSTGKVAQVDKGSKVSQPKERPSRSGYSFLGWMEEGASGYFDFEKEIYQDKTLEAVWRRDDDPRPPVDPPIVDGDGDGETGGLVRPEEIETIEIAFPDIPLGGKLNMLDHFAYIYGYKDHTIRPEGNISREEAAAVFYRLLTPSYRDKIYSSESIFTDVKKDRWSHDDIGTLHRGKIVTGYPDGSFRPRNRVTRAEIAVMASKFDNISYDGKNKFKDSENHWAKHYINSAAINGWLQGSNGNFRPDDNMTRGEFVTMVNKMLDRKTRLENMLEGRKVFKDLDVNKWYYEEIEEAANGHEYTRPDGSEKWIRLID